MVWLTQSERSSVASFGRFRWFGRSKLLSRVEASETFQPATSDVLTLTVEVSSDASYAADAARAEAVRVSLVSVLLLLSRTRQKSIVSSGLSALDSTLG